MIEYTDKYTCTIDNVNTYLDKYGVAVISNILNINECNNYIEQAWNNFNTLTSKMNKPICKNEPDTWKTLYELYPLHSMLLQHWGVGQWDFYMEYKM